MRLILPTAIKYNIYNITYQYNNKSTTINKKSIKLSHYRNFKQLCCKIMLNVTNN